MFLSKNKSSEIITSNVRMGRNNYGFSCGTKKNNVNNSTLSYTRTSGLPSDVFNSLNNQLNNNIRTINNKSNSMFPKKKGGCGCGRK